MATAFTPPTQKTASADSAAARRGEPPRAPVTRGTRTHGARAIGSSSTEVAPRPLIIRGARAYASAPTSRASGVPRCSRRASASTPVNATLSSSAIHNRWVIQGASPAVRASPKKGPIGKR